LIKLNSNLPIAIAIINNGIRLIKSESDTGYPAIGSTNVNRILH